MRYNILLICLALYLIFTAFAPVSIKSSHLWMDSATEQLEPRWSVRCGSNIYKLQKIQIMQQHIYYFKFALLFADMQIPELVTVFNTQMQSRGWSNMRAYHNQALIDEFQHRGVETTSVTGRKTISIAHPVPNNKLVVIN